jgi:hypothetical protein
MITSTPAERAAAPGPLVVSRTNPRYFTVAGDETRAVYLSGSHIWNNLHDGMGPGPECAQLPEELDFEAYLDFLADRGHNFIRLWRWEQVRSLAAGGDFHLCMTPQPWARTGPGNAIDGGPRFDLERFDDAFFERLRERTIAAGDRGIYVDVMLFEGWALHLSPAPFHVAGHPFHEANNVNGVSIGSILDAQVLPLDPRVQSRALGSGQRILRRRNRRRGVRTDAGAGGNARVGRLHRVAVLGDRAGEAIRGGAGLRAAPDRDDDAVPGGRSAEGE